MGPPQIETPKFWRPSITHSVIQGGFPGEGNVDTEPQFADTVRYQLKAGAPGPKGAGARALP